MEETILKKKIGAIILAFLLLGLSSIFYIVKPEKNFAVNPFGKIREYFQGRNTTTTVENVRIISEESQVIEVVKNASPAVVSIIASAEVPKMEQCF